MAFKPSTPCVRRLTGKREPSGTGHVNWIPRMGCGKVGRDHEALVCLVELRLELDVPSAVFPTYV